MTNKEKQFLSEVINNIESKDGLKVVDSFSDWGNKSSIIRKNPKCTLNDNEINLFHKGNNGEPKYFGVCEFSIYKKIKKEYFIIWDYREKQPFDESKYCVNSEFCFGRYEFNDRQSFYNHIFTDFGLTTFDRLRVEKNLIR